MPATTTPAADNRATCTCATPEHITVGTDGSYWGDTAVSWAARHAWLCGAELQVLRPATDSGPSANARLNNATREFPQLAITCHPVDGSPLAELTSASTTSTLMVLGCRGSRHRRLGLGELILPAIGATHCDVAVVRGAPAAVQGEHRCVTAMISGGDNDTTVLHRAAVMADIHKSRLEVVHAVAAYGPHRADSSAILRHAVLRLKGFTPTPRASTTLVWALPHEVIAHIEPTDLIVLGRGESRRRSSFPGAVTKTALFHAPCPVLVVAPSP